MRQLMGLISPFFFRFKEKSQILFPKKGGISIDLTDFWKFGEFKGVCYKI